MKNSHTEKLIYYMMGIGSGIILSGILMLALILNTKEVYQYNTNNAIQLPSDNIDIDKEQLISTEIVNKQLSNETTDQQISTDIANELEDINTSDTQLNQSIESSENTLISQGEDEATNEVIRIDIPNHFGAYQICKLLQEQGIIDNSDQFHQYIKDQGKTTKLRSGTFVFTKDLEYDEVLRILIRKNIN